MAKKAHKKRSGKKKRHGKKRSKVSSAQRAKTVARRAELHKAATLLKDFHGGKLPIKSGCGRPRKRH